MNTNKFLSFACVLMISLFASYSSGTKASYELEKVVDDLKISWAMVWLPNGDLLVSQRDGDILRVTNGKVIGKLSGAPKVRAKGQGGMLDLVLHPEFEANQMLYMTYSDGSGSGGSNTAIARAKLIGDELRNLEVLYKGSPNTSNGRHFGSRMAFDRDGDLFFSIGDRGDRDANPQDLTRDGGKVYRISDDGEVPSGNPYVERGNEGVPAAIYSLGHRNIQGMAMHPMTGDIWTHEHGPRGGDEVNIIAPARNYGWPILSYGINYSGTSFAEDTKREGYESPVWYWDPSIAPSGMAFVTSERYPDWQGHLLVGSLKFGQLVLCELEGDKIVSASAVVDKIGRVRDVRQGPDGFVYLAIDGDGIYRVKPSE